MVYETSVVDCHRIKQCMFSSLFKNSHLMALGYLKDLFVGNAKHINITKKNTIFDVWLEKGYIICEILSIKRID